MKVCLANPASRKYLKDDIQNGKYYLESLVSMRDWFIPLIKDFEFFLLDSGAFTFMTHGHKGEKHINAHIGRYIDFINKYDIKHFFEMDIDALVGFDKVLEYRERIENETGKKVIPVWHKSRGKQEFINMCKQYDYVAIGGIVTGEIKRDEYKYFPWFIDTAHKYGCKIHGLGYTSFAGLYEYHFDSVDSTTWCQRAKFRQIDRFNGRRIESYEMSGDEKMSVELRHKINRNNLLEWIAFQEYADTHL